MNGKKETTERETERHTDKGKEKKRVRDEGNQKKKMITAQCSLT